MQQQVSRQIETAPSSRRQRDGGYLLLAILLMMALMIIAATAMAPRMVQQIKRDREEEMIRRGTEYARAIKKFYKKNGRYPSSLDDLDKNTQIRYLRKRFKDPLTKDGKWKLLNYADIQTLLNAAAPGTPAAALASQGGGMSPGGSAIPGGASSSSGQVNLNFGGQQQSQQPGATTNGFSANSDQGSNQEGVPSSNSSNFGSSSSVGSSQGFSVGSNNQEGGGGSNNNQASGSGTGQQTGTTFGQNSAGGNQTFGGGAVVGVASLSKDPTIRIYNKKKTYDQWQFIYNPMMDQQNVLLRGPYQPTTIGSNNQVGTPAGQMNGQQNSSGQQSNPFGQQSGFGQQNTPQQPTQPSQSPQ